MQMVVLSKHVLILQNKDSSFLILKVAYNTLKHSQVWDNFGKWKPLEND